MQPIVSINVNQCHIFWLAEYSIKFCPSEEGGYKQIIGLYLFSGPSSLVVFLLPPQSTLSEKLMNGIVVPPIPLPHYPPTSLFPYSPIPIPSYRPPTYSPIPLLAYSPIFLPSYHVTPLIPLLPYPLTPVFPSPLTPLTPYCPPLAPLLPYSLLPYPLNPLLPSSPISSLNIFKIKL